MRSSKMLGIIVLLFTMTTTFTYADGSIGKGGVTVSWHNNQDRAEVVFENSNSYRVWVSFELIRSNGEYGGSGYRVIPPRSDITAVFERLRAVRIIRVEEQQGPY